PRFPNDPVFPFDTLLPVTLFRPSAFFLTLTSNPFSRQPFCGMWGDASAPRVVGEGEGKGSAACRQAEGSRRIACESRLVQVRRSARPATSTHRIGPSRTGLRETCTGAGGGKRRRTALTRRARSPLAAFCQALFP